MKLSKRKWKWQTETAQLLEKYYWTGFGLGIGFFSAEIFTSGIKVLVRDILTMLI